MSGGHISTTGLRKRYRVAKKEPGVLGTLRHFVNRKYEDVNAVVDVTVEIEKGEIVGFLGANGAGKTTTLKMLAGLIKPTAGEVSVAGFTPFSREHSFLRKITLVMGQKQQLIWDLPTLDSLRINAAVYEIDDDERDRRIGQLSEMLELGDKLKTPVRKLSLGERMKAELLAALLHRPEVLFLDEPTLGLDVNAQATMRKFLREYNEEYGATVLLTSHYMADITALCERVLVIHSGTLAYDGTLAELSNRVADHREVQVAFRGDVSRDALSTVPYFCSLDGATGRFDVPRRELENFLPVLFARFDVDDLSIEDPPIDEVIGDLFRTADGKPASLEGAPPGLGPQVGGSESANTERDS